ncbi:cysteine dioxygenase [Actinocrispum wychmicini]|uniref:Cysteine dioxygenase type I n=1 Tax=Actinocrispum wychmicini TaxID=1213861 RepID=A0A4R2JJ53_9PSEU|nr:cysteine dioxygenase family protein [Actinocrispum wychmicini]TCO57036.1 cysteine dioxygenase type I [Actinocrispum wychmicini]
MFAVPENTVALSAPLAAAHPSRIAREFAVDRDRWKHLLRYDPAERFATLVDRVGVYEVWLMSWLPGQSTDLHDHGRTTGAFTVVSGTLTERVVRAGTELTLTPGQSRVFAPDYVHQVLNNGIDPAVSIHVYEGAREMHPVNPQ